MGNGSAIAISSKKIKYVAIRLLRRSRQSKVPDAPQEPDLKLAKRLEINCETRGGAELN